MTCTVNRLAESASSAGVGVSPSSFLSIGCSLMASRLHLLWSAAILSEKDLLLLAMAQRLLTSQESALTLLHRCAPAACADHLETAGSGVRRQALDRKSTRLNSSHPSISYAVFCLKK